jgi:hypothetical protein
VAVRTGRAKADQDRQSENLLVNKEIIRQGYGHAFLKYPFDQARMEEFRAAEREARDRKRGTGGRNHEYLFSPLSNWSIPDSLSADGRLENGDLVRGSRRRRRWFLLRGSRQVRDADRALGMDPR